MDTRGRILPVGFLVVVVLVLVLVWDELAVVVCRLVRGGGIPAETGQRVRYVKCLNYCGSAGRREARAFVQKWWSNQQPSRYGAGLLVQARYAYIGVPVGQLLAELGTPARMTKETVVYLLDTGSVEQASESIVFNVRDEHVTDVTVVHEQ